jgi:hypothetical protein
MQQQSPTRKPTSSLERATYHPTIRRLGTHGLFAVQSASNPSLHHIVDSIDNTCTCPAGEHGRRCWHRSQLEQLIQCQQRVQIETAAPIRPSGMAGLLEAFGA